MMTTVTTWSRRSPGPLNSPLKMSMNNTTTAVAAAAVASPAWLPAVQKASEMAAVAAPILGVIWLLVQIVAKLVEMNRK